MIGTFRAGGVSTRSPSASNQGGVPDWIQSCSRSAAASALLPNKRPSRTCLAPVHTHHTEAKDHVVNACEAPRSTSGADCTCPAHQACKALRIDLHMAQATTLTGVCGGLEVAVVCCMIQHVTQNHDRGVKPSADPCQEVHAPYAYLCCVHAQHLRADRVIALAGFLARSCNTSIPVKSWHSKENFACLTAVQSKMLLP